MQETATAENEGGGTFKHLLSPGMLGKLTLKNRVVMPPMGTAYADDDGFITERLASYYRERAEGGAGLIIVDVGRRRLLYSENTQPWNKNPESGLQS